jgi:uncharacterized membrane protein YfcA
MWLYIFVVPLVIIMLVGGLLAGGIFTIVFLPIAVIIAAAAVLYTMWGSRRSPEKIPSEREPVHPLPHSGHTNTAAAPGTPDQLVDARRGDQ